MKILFIAHHTWSFLNFRSPLAQSIQDRNHEIVVCAPENDSEMVSQIEAKGFKFVHIPMVRTGMNPLSDLQYIRRLYRFIKNERPDVVFSMAIKPVIYGSLVSRITGVPRIYSLFPGLGYSFTGGGWKGVLIKNLVRILFKVSLKKNRRIFFQNPDDLSTLKELGVVRPKQAVRVNGSGVNLNRFQQREPVVEPFSFLLIGRMIKDKGIHEFVGAAQVLKARYPQVEFRMMGPTDSNPTAIPESQINQWQEEGVIHYLGTTDDVRPFIESASVFVLPSYREGTPRSVLEAMAIARPIITTDAPGCRETVVDGVNGLLVQPRDIDTLVAAMETLIQNPQRIREMGLKSREMAEDKFDVEKVNAKIISEMNL